MQDQTDDRLFGTMLEPKRWDRSGRTKSTIKEAIDTLKALCFEGVHLSSISFGPHPYEEHCALSDPEASFKEPVFLKVDELYTPWHADAFEYNELAEEDDDRIGYYQTSTDWEALFGSVKAVHLPLLLEGPLDSELACGLYELMEDLPSTVEDLALSVKGPQECFNHRGRWYKSGRQAFALQPFQYLVSTFRLPHLKTLYLQGWVADIRHLKEFLLAHASTLETLHLVDFYVCRSPEDPEPLEQFIRGKLHLRGIEIHRLRHCDPPDHNSDDPRPPPAYLPGSGYMRVTRVPQKEAVYTPIGPRSQVLYEGRRERDDGSFDNVRIEVSAEEPTDGKRVTTTSDAVGNGNPANNLDGLDHLPVEPSGTLPNDNGGVVSEAGSDGSFVFQDFPFGSDILEYNWSGGTFAGFEDVTGNPIGNAPNLWPEDNTDDEETDDDNPRKEMLPARLGLDRSDRRPWLKSWKHDPDLDMEYEEWYYDVDDCGDDTHFHQHTKDDRDAEKKSLRRPNSVHRRAHPGRWQGNCQELPEPFGTRVAHWQLS